MISLKLLGVICVIYGLLFFYLHDICDDCNVCDVDDNL